MASVAKASVDEVDEKRLMQIPLDDRRVGLAEHVIGPLLHVTLPDGDVVQPGDQDVLYWRNVRQTMVNNQLMIVTNDFGTIWRLMRIDLLIGNPANGLRALRLVDVVEPQVRSGEGVKLTGTGEWQVVYLGAHKRWCVVTPQGTIRQQGLVTEAEAWKIRGQEALNPKPV